MGKVNEAVAQIRYLASDIPDIRIALYDEAHRIEALQEADGRSMDMLDSLRDACLDTAGRIEKILKIMSE